MSETPSPYDLTQDALIAPMRDILLAAAEPPAGPEDSFPVVGTALNDHQWGALFKSFGSGIISFGQYPYRLHLDSDADVTNRVRISPATDLADKDSVGVVEGFAHRLNEDKMLEIPAVSTRTRYIIALQYDPARAASGGLPVVLDVFAGALDRTQGRRYVLIYEGYRDPSTVLSSVTWTPVRSRLAPTITVQREEHLPNAQHSGLIWGTRCYCTATNEEWILTHHPTADYMRWERIGPERAIIPMSSARDAMSSTRAPSADMLGGIVTMHGGVRRSNGSHFTVSSDGWAVGRLPAAMRPSRQYDFATPTFSPTPAVVRIRVTEDGWIQAFPAASTSAVMIDGLSFPVR